MPAHNGSIVRFKKFILREGNLGIHYSAPRKEEFFGILMGKAKDGEKQPTVKDCWALLANIGICSFDDVEEALSPAACKKLIKYVEKKYTLPETDKSREKAKKAKA